MGEILILISSNSNQRINTHGLIIIIIKFYNFSLYCDSKKDGGHILIIPDHSQNITRQYEINQWNINDQFSKFDLIKRAYILAW